MQRITAPATEICPECGKPAAHRLISAGTNFILKGGGWYSDLYASPGAAKKPDAKEGKGAAEAAPAAATSDTKAETKSETKTAAAPASSTPSSTPTTS